jgi:hypothetical protein
MSEIIVDWDKKFPEPLKTNPIVCQMIRIIMHEQGTKCLAIGDRNVNGYRISVWYKPKKGERLSISEMATRLTDLKRLSNNRIYDLEMAKQEDNKMKVGCYFNVKPVEAEESFNGKSHARRLRDASPERKKKKDKPKKKEGTTLLGGVKSTFSAVGSFLLE